ncbi:MAG: hypothetical protein B7Y26_10655 [Hydrogenophilales bacterium 16-64-46]|nr:MAG: hypothetical protein B7Z32_11335 [Hydrogenophilales bacterium 12-64-13]OYZ04621.1 MAG: hypothetical protein B7Y26_10655 [Hydrogenophilales bacterium 16-64-46]OZA38307.1 MAG: hypothetical protein B7X87_07370 [Hydrogenophilales bacterium 17-64-34]HQS99660.1 hypothetical protein [Thiobacillus sp.]
MNAGSPPEVESSLKLQRAVVALQFTQTGGVPDAVKTCPAEEAYCRHCHSYEKDLLSHAFRNPPPVRTYCVSCGWHSCALDEGYALRAILHLPRRLRFQSEGTLYELHRRVPADPELDSLDVTLSFSRHDFVQSGRSVLNMVVHIDLSGTTKTFGEYELLCLSKLWCAADESETWVIEGQDEGVWFQIGRERLRPEQISARYFGESGVRPAGGCVQLAFADDGTDSASPPCAIDEDGVAVTACDLIDALNAIQAEDAKTPEARMVPALKAVGCLLQNIFDIENVDLNELDDMLDGISTSRSAVTAIHRNTLFALTVGDRLFDDVEHTIGMSPYLLLPQAVLLHNEAVLFEARALLREIDRVADLLTQPAARDAIRQRLVDAVCADSLDDLPGGPDRLIRSVVRRLWTRHRTRRTTSRPAPHAVKAFIAELDRAILDGLNAHARVQVSALLDRDMLGNIFQYVSERWIFDEGHRDRGLDSLAGVLRKRLEDLSTAIESAEGRHGDWLNSNYTVIALVFTLYQVIPFESAIRLLPGTTGDDGLNPLGVVALVAAGLALVMPFLWHRIVALTYMRALGHVARKLDARQLLVS